VKHLKKFIKDHNAFEAIFPGGGTYPEDPKQLTNEHAQKIFGRLDSNLSPEALTSDGEASRAQIKSRHTLYTGAIKDLESLGFKYEGTFYSYSPA